MLLLLGPYGSEKRGGDQNIPIPTEVEKNGDMVL